MRGGRLAGYLKRLVATFVGAAALVFALPTTAAAHQLTERYQAPLPLVAYVAGAALAVAMSFAFVMLRDAPVSGPRDQARSQPRRVPAWLRNTLRAVGLVAWLWIVVQAVVGGSGAGDVASLFLWVYGWVGVALVCALIGPAWTWLDPFTTLHAILGWAGRRLGLSGGESSDYPVRLGIWPAVAIFALVVWIELVARIDGGRTLGLMLVGYTLLTLAGMSWFGRETWRSRAEVFSVWFGLVGRLAPFELAGPPEEGGVRRRPFAAGLTAGGWSTAQLVLLALATGSIIYDGLSQTELYFDAFGSVDLFGLPVLVRDSLIAAVFMGALTALVLAVARRLGSAAVGAGLLPVAVGYLIAHYLAFLLYDGQRIVAALNDPLLRGDNLLPLDLAFFEPVEFLPTAILWSIQLAAVVGGHVIGAWAGHAALADEEGRAQPLRQLPLAVLMVVLTSVTLWSLGQNVLAPTEAALLR